MKHASLATLDTLSPLLTDLRCVPGLVERQPGIFYFRSAAFLHFHEDAAGLFADAKLAGKGFERFAVNTADQRAALLAKVQGVVAAVTGKPLR